MPEEPKPKNQKTLLQAIEDGEMYKRAQEIKKRALGKPVKSKKYLVSIQLLDFRTSYCTL